MADRLTRLAERIERRPWNQPGSDKTWVLSALSEHQKWLRATKRAKQLSGRPKDLAFLEAFEARVDDDDAE